MLLRLLYLRLSVVWRSKTIHWTPIAIIENLRAKSCAVGALIVPLGQNAVCMHFEHHWNYRFFSPQRKVCAWTMAQDGVRDVPFGRLMSSTVRQSASGNECRSTPLLPDVVWVDSQNQWHHRIHSRWIVAFGTSRTLLVKGFGSTFPLWHGKSRYRVLQTLW